MRLQTLLQRLKKQRAITLARQARAATREDLFPELGVTRLEERRLLNAAPVVMPDSKATVENQTLTVDAADGVLANDNDVDGDTMKAFLNNGPTYGLITLHEDGSFEYKPNTGFSGADSFTYHSNDGQADSNVTTVTLNVAGVNDPPVNNIPLAFYAAPQNGSKDITGISIADPDSGASPLVTRFEVQHGTLSVDTSVPGILVVGNGTSVLQLIGTTTQINATLAKPTGLTYTPVANYLGPDQLKMVTNDGGATGTGGPMIDTDFASLSVQPVDQPPVNTLSVGPLSTNEDTALVINGVSVADPDSGVLPIVTRFEVQHGVLNVSASNPNVTVLGNGTSILHIVGAQNQINATLADPIGLTYTPTANFNGADQLKMVTNDLGGTGLNGPKIDTDFVAINIAAVDDAPVNTLPSGPHTTNEDTPLVIVGISVSDIDSDPSPINVRFEVQHGTLNVDPSNPNVTVLGNGTNIVQLVGLQSQINATLALPTGLTYTPSSNYNGPDQLQMATNDLGATGLGGPLTDTDFAAINVTAINDAPVNMLPLGPHATNEDTPLVITGIAVADVDSNPSPIVTSFEVQHGTLSVDVSNPNVTVVGNGTNTVQLIGMQSEINATLLLPTGLTYTPALNYNGADQLKMVTNDLGASGTGGPLSDTDFASINVSAVNDAPVNSLPPGPYATNEDTQLVITGVSVSDVDSDPSPINARFEVQHGTLTVDGSIPGVLVLGNGTSILQIIGTQAQINATLALPAGLTYAPALNYNGADQLKMITNDLGATGSGGPLTDTDLRDINVTAINDAPVNTLPAGPHSTNEDTPLVISGISISDVDANPSPVVTQFDVQHGTLTVDPSVIGIVIVGNGTNSVQITGTLAQINATLALPTGLTYTPDLNFNGPDQLTMASNDQGATGLGGPLTDTDFASINVVAINDAPVNSLPAGPYATNEDTPLVISGVSVGDVDSDPSPINARFEVQHGTLTVDTSVPGVTVIGNGTSVVQIIGTQAQINATLALATGLTYSPSLNFNGPDQLKMVTNDLGASGLGGPLTDTDFRDINVAPINDAPVNTLAAGPYSTNEDTSLVINGVKVTDVDSDPSPIVAQFTVSHGVLTVDTSNPNVTVVGNGTNTLQLIGLQSEINATLALPTALTYTPGLNYNGPDQLKMVTNDLGASGAGGPLTDTDLRDINVIAINDAPVNNLPAGPHSTNEDTPLVISGISVSDVDSDPSPIITRLEVQHGTLTVDPSVAGVIVVGNGTNVLQIIGTQAQINATLALPTGLTYLGTLNYNGPDQLKMVTNDLGATGLGGPLTDTDFAAINVIAVNDAPVNTLPAGPYGTNEDTPLVLTGISVSDVDSDPSPIITRFEVTHGVLNVDPSIPGVTVIGNGTSLLQIIGTQAQINATLALPTGLTYQPTANYGGPDSLTMTTNDLGATGLGGPLTDTDVRAIFVTPVADKPNLTVTSPAIGNEGSPTPLVITGSLNDLDGSESLSFTISNVPTTAILVDGLNVVHTGASSYTFTGPTALAQVTGMTIQMADDANFVLTVTAFATEQLNGDVASNSAPLQVIINNVAPTITSLTLTPDSLNEGQTATLTGTFSDPGVQDTFVLIVNWGDGTAPQVVTLVPSGIDGSGKIVGSFSITHVYADDNPSGTHHDVNTVNVIVQDDDLGQGVLDRFIDVIDVDPVFVQFNGTDVTAFGIVTLTGTSFDVGVQDQLFWTINWGDGTIQTVAVPNGDFAITHFYSGPPDPLNPTASISIHVTLADDDLGIDTAQSLAAVPGLGDAIFFIASMYYQPPAVLDGGMDKFDVVAPLPVVIPQTQIPFEMRSVRGGQVKVGETGVLLVPIDAVTGKENFDDAAPLPVTVLDRLPDLFAKLPDGEYHLYFVEPGNQRLIMDVVVRGGRPIDPTDDTEGTQDRPPSSRRAEKPAAEAEDGAAAKGDSKAPGDVLPGGAATPDGGSPPDGAAIVPIPSPQMLTGSLGAAAVASVTNPAIGPAALQNPLPEEIPQQPIAGAVIKINESVEAAGQGDGSATGQADGAWRRPSLAPAVMAVAAVAVWTNGRWARQVDADLTRAGADSLSKAARLRRRLRRGPGA